ncbi:hypothetical protein H4V97_000282 [Flavobacterium sp. CG_23.5]|uniref:M56 family metallopeptidase n=1 Tax=unclassified Flavobacterium TaxID=196869 RepID=UPI0018CBC950|nr:MULTISPECIES: M56 family metallopeptidase [unclassified Flavobacterium]MBG6110051.1 hypothetical protein [Flavobacterium sp. CG_9.10]MBP2281964.1 hypothetical protein [Flavobacterium sp. CG_23.5]
MEAVAIYFLKSSGLLLLFFMAYNFLLRKETFFTTNRRFLLAGLLTATILPIVVYTKIIWVAPTPITSDWSSLPIRTVTEENHTEEYIYLGLALTYCIGALALLTKFGFDFYSLRKIFKGKTVAHQANYKFIDTTENLAPFSFFSTIVYNSALYNATELENIIAHEKVHSQQNHSLDVLIAQLFCILFWFNPFIWLYKKAMLQNLEFIADGEASKKIADKKSYQITLLKITTQENCIPITNHFYQSLIKKRIVMLNKNRSNKRNSWKYALVLPALVAFMCLFQVEVVAQEKVIAETSKLKATSPITSTNTNNQETDSIKKNKIPAANATKKEFIDLNTEIYIDGKKVTKKELDSTNPDDIATMDVIKNKNESTIKIVTKGKTTGSKSIFNSDIEKTDLGFDNVDPNNVTIRQKTKDTYTVTKMTREVNGVPGDADYYIDGKKVSPLEAESMSPNLISSMDVNKDATSNKNAIRIITKSYVDGKKNDKIESQTKNEDKGWAISFETSKPEDNIKRIQNDKNVDFKKALIIINGKQSNYQTLEKLDPKNIISMGVQKPSNATEFTRQNAIKKYGKKAINGVIEITTK